jgi:hypothetical protein
MRGGDSCESYLSTCKFLNAWWNLDQVQTWSKTIGLLCSTRWGISPQKRLLAPEEHRFMLDSHYDEVVLDSSSRHHGPSSSPRKGFNKHGFASGNVQFPWGGYLPASIDLRIRSSKSSNRLARSTRLEDLSLLDSSSVHIPLCGWTPVVMLWSYPRH